MHILDYIFHDRYVLTQPSSSHPTSEGDNCPSSSPAPQVATIASRQSNVPAYVQLYQLPYHGSALSSQQHPSLSSRLASAEAPAPSSGVAARQRLEGRSASSHTPSGTSLAPYLALSVGPEASTTASLPRAELPLPNHQSIGGPDVHMRTTNEPSGNSPASAPAAASDQPPARISLKDCRSRACAGVVDSFKRALRPRGEVALEGPARDPGSAGLAAFAAQTAAATDRQDEALAAAAAAAGGADAAGGCPPDTWQLGRATWTFLHSMAAAYPEQPSPRQQELMRYMMEGLAEFYPCEVCAEHLREQVRRRPPRVASAKDLNMWLCGIHNEVNEMLGKPLFDCNLLMERWRDGPPDGSCD